MKNYQKSSLVRNLKSNIIWIILLLAISLIPVGNPAHAQEGEPSGPVYIVQEGDTLWDIAQRFGVPWEDLAWENEIDDPGHLSFQ